MADNQARHDRAESQNGRRIDAQVQAAAHLGQGLARLDGKIVLLPFVAVGDRVEAEIVADHGSWARAKVIKTVEPGPGHTTPGCPVYGICGGCHLLHLDDETRAAWKIAALKDVLCRLGGLSPEDTGSINFVSAPVFNWRCRMTMHMTGSADARDAGFYEQGSHRIVPPGDCLAAMEPVANLLEPIRQAVKRSGGGAAGTVEPVCGSDGRCVVVINQDRGDVSRLARETAAIPGVNGVWSRTGRESWKSLGDRTISFPTAGAPGQTVYLNPDPRGFTQAHLRMNPTLVETILTATGQPVERKIVLELYAGAGNITIPLAMRKALVMASDINKRATESGARYCADNGLEVTHMAGDTKRVLESLPERFRRPDMIIADPPRTGMGHQAAAVAKLQAPAVVICSCEPSALARDVRHFTDVGYRIKKITLVDMFPTTYHMETIINLTFNR